MAELPIVGVRTIQEAPERPNYVDVDARGLGAGLGGLGAFGEGLTRLAAGMQRVEEEKRANDVMKQGSELKSEMIDFLYAPETGIMFQQGSNAQGVRGRTREKLDELLRRGMDSIQDPKARMGFERWWRSQSDSTMQSVSIHEGRELERYKAESTEAMLATSVKAAADGYLDTPIVDKSIADAHAAILANAQGKPKEAVELALAESTSQIRSAQITRAAADSPRAALNLYKQYKDDLTPKDLIRIDSVLEPVIRQEKIDSAYNQISGAGGLATDLVVAGGASMPSLLVAVADVESSGNPDAVSPAGAIGILQVMPGTAREISESLGDGLLDGQSDGFVTNYLKNHPERAALYGAVYLQRQLDRYKLADGSSDIEAALIAYNAGPARADKFIRSGRDYGVLPEETQQYVPKVLSRFTASSTVPGGGKPLPEPGVRMTRENWNLANLKPEDILAPTAGGAWVDARAATALDNIVGQFQQRFGKRIKINEAPGPGTAGRRRGTADPRDNPHVPNSQHVHGRAFDVQIQHLTDEEKAGFLAMARAAGFGGVGFYGPGGHLHIDMGRPRTWGTMPTWARGPMAIRPGATPVSGGVAGALTGGGTVPGRSVPSMVRPPVTARADVPNFEWRFQQANSIDDPEVRAGVLQRINSEMSMHNKVQAEELEARKQSAWDMVLGGTDPQDLPPEVLSGLPAEYISTLANAKEKLDAGPSAVTDWDRYNEIIRMSNQQILDLDLKEEFPRLATPEFNKIRDMQAEVAERLRNGKSLSGGDGSIEGVRTYNQIFDAVTKSYKLGPESLARLTEDINARATYAANVKGKPLSPIEYQQELKALLEAGFADPSFPLSIFQSSGYRLDGSSGFQPAASINEVPPDRAEVISRQLTEIKGKPAAENEVLSIFNRATKVKLGLRPEYEDDMEEEAWLGQVRTQLGTTVTPEEARNYYGQWLVRILDGSRVPSGTAPGQQAGPDGSVLP